MDIVDLAADAARKEGVEFVSTVKGKDYFGNRWPTECYFDLGDRRNPSQVAKKTSAIARRLERLGIGDERGVYIGDDWYCADVVLSGVSFTTLVDLACGGLDGKSLTNVTDVYYYDDDPNYVEFIHRHSQYDPICICNREDDSLLAKFCTETSTDLGLQVRYLFGIVSNQLFDIVSCVSATISHSRLPFWCG